MCLCSFVSNQSDSGILSLNESLFSLVLHYSFLRHFNQMTQSKSRTIYMCSSVKLDSSFPPAVHVVLLYFRLLADLNSPLFIPDVVSLDRKHILEDIETKYREFITATLRCLSELKRELCEWPMGHTPLISPN